MERTRYPRSEGENPWLTPLLDTYHQTDEALRLDIAKTELKPLCKKGCDSCCHNHEIPLNEIELQGISWYVTEVLREETREKLIEALENFSNNRRKCPFLIEQECSIYAMRPLACRTYYVLGRPCKQNENISITRPYDKYISPIKELEKAAQPLLKQFGFTDKRLRKQAFNSGFLLSRAIPLLSLDWRSTLLPDIELHDALYRSV
jgi:Fe-S-cluster containining protein